MDIDRKYYPGKECSICKGRCCKEHGCALAPTDLFHLLNKTEINRDDILNLLTREDSYLAIDHFQSYDSGVIYYLRVRHKCYTFIGIDAIGECLLLTDNGCSLPIKDRPFGGKSLISSADFHCLQEYDEEKMTKDWLPYQEILSSIWQEYFDKFTEDGTFDKCDNAYFEYIRSRFLKTQEHP